MYSVFSIDTFVPLFSRAALHHCSIPPPARLSPLLTAPHHTLTSHKVLPSRAALHHCSSSTSSTSFFLSHSTTSYTNISQGPSFQGSPPPLLQFHLQHVFLPCSQHHIIHQHLTRSFRPGLPSTIAPVPPPARLSPLLTAPHHTLTSHKVLPSRAALHHCSSSTSGTSFSLGHSTTSYTNISQGPPVPPPARLSPLLTAPHHTLTSHKVLPSRAPLHCSSSTSCTSFSLAHSTTSYSNISQGPSPLLTAPHHTLTSHKILPSRAALPHCSSSTSSTSFSLAHSTTSYTNISQGSSFQGSPTPLLQFHLQHVFLPCSQHHIIH